MPDAIRAWSVEAVVIVPESRLPFFDSSASYSGQWIRESQAFRKTRFSWSSLPIQTLPLLRISTENSLFRMQLAH